MVCFMCVFRMHASVFGREPCLPERRVSTGARRFCARGTAPQKCCVPWRRGQPPGLESVRRHAAWAAHLHLAMRRGHRHCVSSGRGSVPGEPGVACLDFGRVCPGQTPSRGGWGDSHSQAPGATRPAALVPARAPVWSTHCVSGRTQPRAVTPAVPSLSPVGHRQLAIRPAAPGRGRVRRQARDLHPPPAPPVEGPPPWGAVSPGPGARGAGAAGQILAQGERASPPPGARGPTRQAAAGCLAVPGTAAFRGFLCRGARRALVREPVHGLHPLPPGPRGAGAQERARGPGSGRAALPW